MIQAISRRREALLVHLNGYISRTLTGFCDSEKKFSSNKTLDSWAAGLFMYQSLDAIDG